MKLRGITKRILEISIDSALLGVEVYNKPRTAFRSQNYIILMIIAWTQLFHAYFHKTIGDKYYYKRKNKYEIIDGQKKAWDLDTCIDKYAKLNDSIVANLRFFINLRNIIEHRTILFSEIDTLIFGECQSLLYNYESTLQDIFGSEYSLNENLVFSLQFSTLRKPEQILSNKSAMLREAKNIMDYISMYRDSLPEIVYNSQEFSVKLICVPRISNTNRHDLAIEFVKWSDLSEEDKLNYNKLNAIIKERIITKETDTFRVVEHSDEFINIEKQALVTTSDPKKANATLYYDTLSSGIFDDANKILQANAILSKDNNAFKFDQTIYYRIYSNRNKLNAEENNLKILSQTGLRFYAPCLFWFNLLSDKVFFEVLNEFATNPKYPGITNAIIISLLLGSNAIDWIERKLKNESNKRFIEDDRALKSLNKMKKLHLTDDTRLAAIQRKRTSTINLPDKNKIKASQLLSDISKTTELLNTSCQKVSEGYKTYRGLCRMMDVLTYGNEIQKRGYKITKLLT